MHIYIYTIIAHAYLSFYIFEMQTRTHKYKCTHSYLEVNQNHFLIFHGSTSSFCLLTPQSLIHITLKGKKKYASVLQF